MKEKINVKGTEFELTEEELDTLEDEIDAAQIRIELEKTRKMAKAVKKGWFNWKSSKTFMEFWNKQKD